MTAATRITTPFGHDSTAAEVISGVDLTGKRAIVTGSASGIGIETARALASAGAEVTFAVRNLDAGRAVAQQITERTANPKVLVAPLELTDGASVAALARSWDGPLDILVTNAGIMALPELTRTSEGWETQFATNHLGHFALAVGLHDALAAAGGARVPATAGRQRPLLRRRQRGRTQHDPRVRAERRAPLRPRPRIRRTALGHLARDARPPLTKPSPIRP